MACPRNPLHLTSPTSRAQYHSSTQPPTEHMEQGHADRTQRASHGGDAPANAQQCDGPNQQHQHQKQSPDGQRPSSLNPTAARLLREAIVSKPAEGGGKPAADGSSDILAFARSVDRVDSTLE